MSAKAKQILLLIIALIVVAAVSIFTTYRLVKSNAEEPYAITDETYVGIFEDGTTTITVYSNENIYGVLDTYKNVLAQGEYEIKEDYLVLYDGEDVYGYIAHVGTNFYLFTADSEPLAIRHTDTVPESITDGD